MEYIILTLNVGGLVYHTTCDTLLKSPFFKKFYANQTYIFVDRDGFVFSHILCFLRTGKVFVDPKDQVLIKYLLCEAEYFELGDMIDILNVMLD